MLLACWRDRGGTGLCPGRSNAPLGLAEQSACDCRRALFIGPSSDRRFGRLTLQRSGPSWFLSGRPGRLLAGLGFILRGEGGFQFGVAHEALRVGAVVLAAPVAFLLKLAG